MPPVELSKAFLDYRHQQKQDWIGSDRITLHHRPERQGRYDHRSYERNFKQLR